MQGCETSVKLTSPGKGKHMLMSTHLSALSQLPSDPCPALPLWAVQQGASLPTVTQASAPTSVMFNKQSMTESWKTRVGKKTEACLSTLDLASLWFSSPGPDPTWEVSLLPFFQDADLSSGSGAPGSAPLALRALAVLFSC